MRLCLETGAEDSEMSRASSVSLRSMKSRPGITFETEMQTLVEAQKRDTALLKYRHTHRQP